MKIKELNQVVWAIMNSPARCTVRTPLLGFNPADPSQHNTLRYDQVQRRQKLRRRAK